MLNIKRFDVEEFADYGTVIDYVNEAFEEKNGDYFVFEYQDEERVLYKFDDCYTVFYYDEKKDSVEYNMFSYSPQDHLVSTGIPEGNLYFNKNGEIFEDKKHVIHTLMLVPTGRGSEGNVLYTQYNPIYDTTAILFYDHHYIPSEEHQHIYENRLKNPIKVVMRGNSKAQKHKSYTPYNSKIYSRVDYGENQDSLMCKIALIKEYGLINFLRNGPYNLIQGNDYSRYRRIVKINGRGELVYLPLLGAIYDFDGIKEGFKQKGFRTDVPKELLSIYNREDKEFEYMLPLGEELELFLEQEKKGEEDVKSHKM